MKYLYAGLCILTAVIWVPAVVCVILASIRQAPPMELFTWSIIAILAVTAGRLAGSLLKAEIECDDKTKEKETPRSD